MIMQEAQGPFGQAKTEVPSGPMASSSATAAAADAAPDPFAAHSPSSPTTSALTGPTADAALSNGHESLLQEGHGEDEGDGNGWEGFDDLTATSPGSPKALIGKVLSGAHSPGMVEQHGALSVSSNPFVCRAIAVSCGN